MNNRILSSELSFFEPEGDIGSYEFYIGKRIKYTGKGSIKAAKNSKNNQLIIQDDCKIKNLKIEFNGSNNKITLEKKVKWTGKLMIVGNNHEIRIGESTTAENVYILARDGNVKIGKDCMLSRVVELRTSDAHKIFDVHTKKHLNLPKDIVIGDHVWVGARSIINKGTIISNGSVIGAMSFVNKAFSSSNVVIAGVPAKIVKEDVEWTRK